MTDEITDPNYLKAQAALDEANSLIEETESLMAEAELEADFAEIEQMSVEIDRALDFLDRLCEAEDFSDKIKEQFPALAEKSTDELKELEKRQSELENKLFGIWGKRQESCNKVSETLAFDAENLSEKEKSDLNEKEAKIKKKATEAEKKYLRAKKTATAIEILLSDRELSEALENIKDSERASKFEAEIALLYKEIAIHYAKSNECDEKMAELDESEMFGEEYEKLSELSFSEFEKIDEKIQKILEILDELSALVEGEDNV